MPPDLEIEGVNCILRMQDLGFGLTVGQGRRVACKVIEATGINSHLITKVKWLVGIHGSSENDTVYH
jgi:hypothetical protein